MRNLDSRFDFVADLKRRFQSDLYLDEEQAKARYEKDWTGDHWGRAALVLRPRSTGDVSDMLSFCHAKGITVVPQGGHTGLVGAATPSETGREVILSLERLNSIISIDATNFSITVEAGCVLQDVHDAAAAENRLFPLSLGAKGSCQIGGNIATNAGGLNVLRYGMMRDLVLGLEVVLPDGRVFNGLRALRKNNLGYDIKQLFIGSEGTLGVITAAVLKLFPNPRHTVTAFVAVNSVEDALHLYASARTELCDLLSAFELIPAAGLELAISFRNDLRAPVENTSRFYVLMEIQASGDMDLNNLTQNYLAEELENKRIVDVAIATSGRQSAEFWAIREAMVEAEPHYGQHLRTDVSVPISRLAEFIAETDRALEQHFGDAIRLPYGHIGDGNIHYNVLPPRSVGEGDLAAYLRACESTIFEIVDRFEGSISAEHGVGVAKRSAFIQRIMPVELEVMTACKRFFDPAVLMNPGRILPNDSSLSRIVVMTPGMIAVMAPV